MTPTNRLSAAQLISLGPHAIHEMARAAVGTLTTFRLMLGRCLLAMLRSESYLEFGCSGAVHYAVSQLGLRADEARGLLRVARLLEELPLLTLAAEEGWLSWSKLREVVRVATPENERAWLELCKRSSYRELEGLVARRREVDSQECAVSQLRLQMGPEAMAVVERTVRVMCERERRVLSPALVLEMVCADYLARHAPLQPELDRAAEVANEAAVECSAREIWEAGTACTERVCPGNEALALVEAAPVHWQNDRLRYNQEARLVTAAQRTELVRRDGYRCKTPGCPHHLFLEVHHVKFWSEQGATVPENLVCLCSKCHGNVHRGHLKIEGEAPYGLTFRDARGRDLGRQSDLETAQWLDFFVGWRGGEDDSYLVRAMTGGKAL